MSGQDDGATAAASFTGFEPAPVSARLMSGSVVVRSYGESWAGDESDILLPDQARHFRHRHDRMGDRESAAQDARKAGLPS